MQGEGRQPHLGPQTPWFGLPFLEDFSHEPRSGLYASMPPQPTSSFYICTPNLVQEQGRGGPRMCNTTSERPV